MYPLDLAALRSTPLRREPFDYLIVPAFVLPEAQAAIHAAYPLIDSPGSFPAGHFRYGAAFRDLLDALHSAPARTAFEEKFGMALGRCGTLVTVRGRCGPKDGRIHTDTASKLITVLIYMNASWEEQGGRLRLLRSGEDLEDVVAEVPPVGGTLVAFRRSDNSWHGHKPFIGPRRVIQFNWVTNPGVARRELFKHRVSAWLKRLRSAVGAADPSL